MSVQLYKILILIFHLLLDQLSSNTKKIRIKKMKKKLGNCIVSGNMKSMDILSFYDLTEKKQAN